MKFTEAKLEAAMGTSWTGRSRSASRYKWRELNLDKAGEDAREAIIAELKKVLWL